MEPESARFKESVKLVMYSLMLIAGGLFLLIAIILPIMQGHPTFLDSFLPTEFGRTQVTPGVVIVILIIFFLIIREIVTWYWKINKMVSLLEEIRDNTRK